MAVYRGVLFRGLCRAGGLADGKLPWLLRGGRRGPHNTAQVRGLINILCRQCGGLGSGRQAARGGKARGSQPHPEHGDRFYPCGVGHLKRPAGDICQPDHPPLRLHAGDP